MKDLPCFLSLVSQNELLEFHRNLLVKSLNLTALKHYPFDIMASNSENIKDNEDNLYLS